MDLSAVNANTTTTTDLFKQRRVAMQVMDRSIQPDDFVTTQVSFANLQEDMPSQPSAAGTANTHQNPWQSTLKTDLSNLTNAVQEGDRDPPRSGWQPVQQENPTSPASSNVAPSDTADQSNNQFLNNLANLLNSVVAGVQTAAATLQQDFQKAFGAATPDTATTSPITTQSITTQSITTQSITTQSINAPATSGPSNSFLGDLQALITAAGSNDTLGLQTAANNLAQNLQGATGGSSTAFNAKAFFEQIDREGHSG